MSPAGTTRSARGSSDRRGPDRVLRSRRVVLPGGPARPACVVVRDGRIAAIEPWDAALEVTDELGEFALLPGVVDTHVHVNEPGRAEWEGFRTATLAAAAGGVTTIVDMPLNSVPATTDAAALRAKVAAMAGALHADVGLWGGLVPGNAPELEPLAAAGALGFKCFLAPSGVDEFPHVSPADIARAGFALARIGRPLLAHAEDPARLLPLAAPTRRHADWLASRPPEAEADAIRSLAAVASGHGVRLHVVHVASREALAALDAARSAHPSLALTGETCPHYLMFHAGEIGDGETAFKCAPPIRDASHRDALREAVLDGRLSLVASDHSPSPPALKRLDSGDFTAAWGGIASLELSLAVTWTALRGARFGLRQLAERMSAAPARLAGLDRRKGAIAPGRDADLVAFEPDAALAVDQAAMRQRHKLTPYHGRALGGRVIATWLRGERAFDVAAPEAEPRGRWLLPGGRAVDPASAFA